VATEIFILPRLSLVLSNLIIEFRDAFAVMNWFDFTFFVKVTLHNQREFTAPTLLYFLHLIVIKLAELSFA
jgi:hypothetical protein